MLTDDSAERLLEDLSANLQSVLGTELVAIYLYGSYVSGGFDAGISDLDLMAVTESEVEELDLPGLERLNLDLVGRYPGWIDRLEIVYIGRTTLESFRTSPGRLAVISPGEAFNVRSDRASYWLQNWYLVRETGRTLYGAPAAKIIPIISPAEYVAATVRYAIQIADRISTGASPGSIAYAILALCRAQLTVETGLPCSKQDGAASMRDRMPRWAPLIDDALRCRASGGMVGFEDATIRETAVEFVRLVAATLSD